MRAIARENLGQFLSESGLTSLANATIHDAVEDYMHWGAVGKVGATRRRERTVRNASRQANTLAEKWATEPLEQQRRGSVTADLLVSVVQGLSSKVNARELVSEYLKARPAHVHRLAAARSSLTRTRRTSCAFPAEIVRACSS